MHRQSSRNTPHMDTIECNADTDDLVLDEDLSKRDYEQRSKSRRDDPYKRSNEISTHRPKRHSPPSVTYKRHSSPPSIGSSSRSHHYPSQRHHRTSSPSSPTPPPPPPPPPPPLPSSSSSSQSSSRHHRSTRPVVPTKRPHPQSESPYERRPPTHRSRQELSTERTIGDVVTFIPPEETKITGKQETNDRNLVPQDDSNRTHHSRSNRSRMNDSSLVINDSKLHSTPSISVPQPTSNESLLEISNISQECELSLYPRSTLSTTNTSLVSTPPTNPPKDMMQSMDLISKYSMVQATLSKNPQFEALSKEIYAMIQKDIALHKIELENREKEAKIRERELAQREREAKLHEHELSEREKRFNIKSKSSEPITSVTPVNSESSLITKPNITEQTTPIKSESSLSQDIVNVSPEESVVSSIPPTADASKVTLPNKTISTHPSVGRKTRFSQLDVDPSIFASSQKPVLELYSDDLDASADPNPATLGSDLKITSSSTCRKVEIQGGMIDKSNPNRELPNDLRLTLGKNRARQSNNDEQHQTSDGNETNDEQQSMLNLNENKQQSYDYQQQRSFTPIEPIMDNTNERRDVRRHRQQYSTSSTNNNSNERSYKQGSSRYPPNQKRYDNDDRPSRGFDYNRSKPSRPPHKNNY